MTEPNRITVPRGDSRRFVVLENTAPRQLSFRVTRNQFLRAGDILLVRRTWERLETVSFKIDDMDSTILCVARAVQGSDLSEIRFGDILEILYQRVDVGES